MDAGGQSDLTLNNDDYCELCRKSLLHNIKGHIYSKNHRKVVASIFLKFDKKMAAVHTALESPAVEAVNGHNTQTFWCYFCGQEDRLHEVDEFTCLLHAGLVRHLASPFHHQSLDKFWRKHRLKMPKEKYKLDMESVKKYQVMSKQAEEKFLFQRHLNMKKEANRIAKQERSRHGVFYSQVSQPMRASFMGDMDPSQLGEASTMHVMAAPDAGVTSIRLPKLSRVSGNVHSGAAPPWLQDSAAEGLTNDTIGPTKEDLQKHLAAEKKAKLPANRVRSKVMGQQDSASWLPSFGRVWNKNRRLKSKQQFMQESSRRMSTPLVPYHRKDQTRLSASSSTASCTEHNITGSQAQGSNYVYSLNPGFPIANGGAGPSGGAQGGSDHGGLPSTSGGYPQPHSTKHDRYQTAHHHSNWTAQNPIYSINNITPMAAYRSKRCADPNNPRGSYVPSTQVLKKSRINISGAFF